jgi:hypothetical protein
MTEACRQTAGLLVVHKQPPHWTLVTHRLAHDEDNTSGLITWQTVGQTTSCSRLVLSEILWACMDIHLYIGREHHRLHPFPRF